MAAMRLFWRYPSDAGTASLPNGAFAGFPAANMQNAILTSVAKSDGGDATDKFTFDLGAVRNITAFYVDGHDFLEADTLTFRYASDAGFSSDVGTETPTWYSGKLVHFFSVVTRRYVQLEVVKAVAAETRQLGRFVVGDHTLMTRTIAVGFGLGGGSDTADNVTTKGGQDYGTIGVSKDDLTGSIIVSEAEMLEIETLKDTYQTSVPFVTAVDYEGFPAKKTIYGRFASMAKPTDTGAGLWTYSWNQIEQK